MVSPGYPWLPTIAHLLMPTLTPDPCPSSRAGGPGRCPGSDAEIFSLRAAQPP